MSSRKPIFLPLLFAAGCALGSMLPKLSPPSAPISTPTSHTSAPARAVAGEEPREQLQWLARHANEEIDFPATLADLARHGLGKNQRAHTELLTLWASRDPQAALAYCMGLRGWNRQFALEALALGWAQKDVAAMAVWLNSEEGRTVGGFRSQALLAIARRDPNLAFSLLNEEGRRNGEIDYFQLFSTLGKTDPRAGLHLLEQLAPDERATATSSLLSTWAAGDPEAAISWAQGLKDPERRSQAMQFLMSRLDERNLTRMASFVSEELSMPGLSSNTAGTYLSSILYQWIKKDPAAAREWIATLPPEHRQTALNNYRNLFAQIKPEEYLKTLETAKSLPADEQFILVNSLSSLARNDPAKVSNAVEWLKRNQDWLPPQTVSSVLSYTVQLHPELSPQLLPMLVKGEAADSVYRYAAEKWADKDGAAAERFLTSLPPGPERDAFAQGMFQHVVGIDMQAACKLVETMPEGTLRASMLQSLAAGATDYQATADWVTSRYGTTREATNAIDTMLMRWSSASPAEAAAWLTKTPAGPQRDQYIRTFSNAIVQHDPDTAIQWASSIGDEKARDRAMEAVAREWINVDRNAAREWIATAPFTDKVKERLLK